MRKLLALLMIGTLFIAACGTVEAEKEVEVEIETEKVVTGTVTGTGKSQLSLKLRYYKHDTLFIQTESGDTMRFFDYGDGIIGKAKKGGNVTVLYNTAFYHTTHHNKEYIDENGFLRGKRAYAAKWYLIEGIKFLDK